MSPELFDLVSRMRSVQRRSQTHSLAVLVSVLGFATACAGTASSRASAPPPTASPITTATTAAESTATPTAATPTAPATSPPTTGGSVDARVLVYGDCRYPSLEPSEIVVTCADYGQRYEGLHWTAWTATTATAVGTGVYTHCTPYCPPIGESVSGVKITLTTPVRSRTGQVVWSEIQESPEPPGYQNGPYHGNPQPLPTQPD